MDQEKFDQHLMDYLFDELDEVTRAAMKRKIESDAECRALEAGLRATLSLAQLPTEEPDPDLEDRILAAADLAQQREPWSRKIVRTLSWAGSRAMNRQLAMAAVLMLMLGSAVLFLRPRPGSVAVTPVKDTAPVPAAAPEPEDEQESEPTELAQKEPPRAPATAAPEALAKNEKDAKADEIDGVDATTDAATEAELDAQYQRALNSFKAGDYAAAEADFGAVAGSKHKNAGMAGLYIARSVRATKGCEQAIPRYAQLRGGGVGADAMYEQADCHLTLGQTAQARELFLELAKIESYRDRATAAIENIGQAAGSGNEAVASRSRASPPKKAAATPPSAAPPPSGGSGAKAKAAPAEDAFDAAPPSPPDNAQSF
jgi:hypothetical protein